MIAERQGDCKLCHRIIDFLGHRVELSVALVAGSRDLPKFLQEQLLQLRPRRLSVVSVGLGKIRPSAPRAESLGEDFWKSAHVVVPPGKTSVHLRVDRSLAFGDLGEHKSQPKHCHPEQARRMTGVSKGLCFPRSSAAADRPGAPIILLYPSPQTFFARKVGAAPEAHPAPHRTSPCSGQPTPLLQRQPQMFRLRPPRRTPLNMTVLE